MRAKFWKAFGILVGVLGLVLLWRTPLSIASTPSGAEVWGDGEYLGVTPLEIGGDWRSFKEIEILSDGYYLFNIDTNFLWLKRELVATLVPAFSDNYLHWYEVDAGGTDSQFVFQEWHTMGGMTVRNMLTGENVGPIFQENSSPADWENKVIAYDLTFSPNGDHLAFLVTPTIFPKCLFTHEELWLTSFSAMPEREQLFDSVDGDIHGCRYSISFSPNGRWILIKVREAFGEGDFFPVLIDIFSGETHILLDTILRNGRIVWTLDSSKVAFISDLSETHVYELNEQEWELSVENLAGWPITFDPVGGTLWTYLPYEDEGHSIIRAFDLEEGDLLSEHRLGFPAIMNYGGVWDGDQETYAVVLEGRPVDPDSGERFFVRALLLLGKNGVDLEVVDDRDYSYPVYWMEDLESWAILVPIGDSRNDFELVLVRKD